MNLTGLKFKIGTNDGEYASGTSITDSIFELMLKTGAEISSISYSNQQYAEGWVITGRKLDFSTLFSTSDGTTVFVNFDQTVALI